MTTIDGLKVKLFACEPNIRQPIFVKCDDRGRLWTIQYLQYPNPAGLKRVLVDRWSRTVYDRVPKPPPYGPRGADRITILEDTDGDGAADTFKDFVDGLNLVTGVEFGHGGVFVLNVPYLLFYPDRNRDDVPDSDPEVLLSGFGMEDAQSMSNHLTWGPDGWLYGVNGSTTTCQIRGIEFQQGLWRYHPITNEFELFCEGGSNCYGVTFDANGELYYSTNGGPFVHAMQGAYFFKSFGKHGPLHNLFAYHHFPNVTCDQVPGGPPTGGTIYLAKAFPPQLHGKFVAGNFLGHTASWWEILPSGSTVTARFGEVLLDSYDSWFGPTDMCLAPDGCMYVCDFYDQRTAHPDPDANWDRTNGRIYKIEPSDHRPAKPIDIVALNSHELVKLLQHDNHWFADRARVELAHRRDQGVAEKLRQDTLQTDNRQLSLESLWALHVTAGLDDALVRKLLEHPEEYVPYWAIRLTGDKRESSCEVADALARLAGESKSPVIRAQLASSAKRLPREVALPIIRNLIVSDPHDQDERVPWLIWWSIEAKSMTATDSLLTIFANGDMWTNPSARDNALRLIRRWASEGTSMSYDACARLISSAPTAYLADAHEHLRRGLAERSVGLQGIGQGGLFGQHAEQGDGAPITSKRHFEPVRGKLRAIVARAWNANRQAPQLLALAIHVELADSKQVLQQAAFHPGTSVEDRTEYLELLADISNSTQTAHQIGLLLQSEQPDSVKMAALDLAVRFDDRELTSTILAEYEHMSAELQSRVRDVLFSRPRSALAFLGRVDRGNIAADSVPVAELRRLALLENERIDEIVRRLWGQIGPGSSEEKLATMRRYNNDLRPGGGDPQLGRPLFTKHCGVCHQLHDEGGKVGPDLTTANRNDQAALLANIVDPSAVVRREYVSFVVITNSGQVLNGLIAEQDGASITLLDANDKRIKIPREEIDELYESATSLMPERILENLTPQQLRDLFAYLERR